MIRIRQMALASAALALAVSACAPTVNTSGVVPQTSGGATRLAPDDTGDVTSHHDYVLRQNGVESAYVWIPRFEAYQLIRPEAAGHAGKPRGYWLKDQPAGIEGVDWVRESFGGFYAAKYEASKAASGAAVSVRGASPWNAVTWPEANAAAESVLPGRSHLMRGDEWTALSVWAFTHGIRVRGNTLFGQDADDANLKWDGASQTGPSATGTGNRSDWDGKTNLTSHTGRTDGVFDLVGNLQEWDGALAMRGYDLEIDGSSTGLGGTLPGYVATLHTDVALRRYGIAGTTQAVPNTALSADFYADFFHGGGLNLGHGAAAPAGDPQLFRAARGGSFERGHHDDPSQAGMWLLCMNRDDAFRSEWMGFRPALKY
jgi:hypothetical protein